MASRLEQLLDMYAQGAEDSFILFAIAQEYQQKENHQKAIAYYEKLRRY